MKRMLYIWIALLLVLAPLSVLAQDQQKVVTLGADLTPEQRTELLQLFGAAEDVDEVLTVTTDEMRTAMQDIIPVPEGYISVSSTALTCAAPGSGLRVTTSNITRVSAAMYAAALITAGVGDVEMTVAAPANAQAEGMTALTGLFKGMEGGVCGRGEIDPTRRALAYRQLALAADIADTTGGNLTTASDMVMRAQESLVEQQNNPDQAGPITDKVQSDLGLTLPQPQRDALVQLLGDMGRANIDWGTYATGWEIQTTSDTEVTVQPSGVGDTGAGRSVTGQPTGLAGTILRVNVDGQEREFGAANVPVTRDGQPAQLTDIQIGDTVTIDLDENNNPIAIRAISGNGGTTAGGDRTVTGVANTIENNTLNLTINGQRQQFGAAANVPITRNGQSAQLSDIQPNDTVSVDLDANNQPTAIRAVSGANEAGFNWRRWWWLCLLPLIPLLLLLARRRRPDRVVVVENEVPPASRRTTVVEQTHDEAQGGARRVDIIEDDTDVR